MGGLGACSFLFLVIMMGLAPTEPPARLTRGISGQIGGLRLHMHNVLRQKAEGHGHADV